MTRCIKNPAEFTDWSVAVGGNKAFYSSENTYAPLPEVKSASRTIDSINKSHGMRFKRDDWDRFGPKTTGSGCTSCSSGGRAQTYESMSSCQLMPVRSRSEITEVLARENDARFARELVKAQQRSNEVIQAPTKYQSDYRVVQLPASYKSTSTSRYTRANNWGFDHIMEEQQKLRRNNPLSMKTQMGADYSSIVFGGKC